MSGIKGFQLFPLGDSAVVVQFEGSMGMDTYRKVQCLTDCLRERPFMGMVEFVPAFTSVTVVYDCFQIYKESRAVSPYAQVCGVLRDRLENLQEEGELQVEKVVIPVCYGGEFGPDLDEVAAHNGLTADEVVEIHSRGEYFVYMIGFAPGFPYLGGLSEKIAAPRRATPRLAIPAGTVGIAGMQTGVYPIETPGGWQLIGRTPVRLFRPSASPPTLLRAGQVVTFSPISAGEFSHWQERAV